MSYKLFVADMDGTLLDDNKKISVKNIQTIKKLQDFGIRFAVATGRHDSMIKSYLKHLDLNVPVISCNGAMVREPFGDQELLSQALPKAQSLAVIDICKEKNATFHIYGHESILGEKLSHKMLYYHNLNKTLPSEERTKLVVVPDCKDIVLNGSEPLYKFLILSDTNEDLPDIKDRLDKIEGLTVCQSMPKLLDVMKEGITKAYALQKLSESLGIKRNEIAAIEKTIGQKGNKKNGLVQDPHILKSFKYSTIVIAEAIASTLQHILAKKYNVVIDGYMAVFSKSKDNKVISTKLLMRLQPFFRFRNMLVHQYWRVDNIVFENNLRDGLNDFRMFVNEIRKIIKEDCEKARGKD